MKKKKVVYIIGSLRNQKVPETAIRLREELPDFEIFDSWFSPGPHADDYWRKYEKAKGVTYKQALNDWAAKHIFEFDTFHLNRADIVIMVMPAGKSGHLELGYAIGKGKKGYMLFDQEPARWDVMYQFASDIFFEVDDLILELKRL